MKGGHGGKRENAGRTALMAQFDRWAVGQQCEELWRQECQAAQDKAVEVATKTAAVEWKKVNEIPVTERSDWLDGHSASAHRDDVEFAMRTDQGIDIEATANEHEPQDDREPSRVLRLQPPRPKGVRKKIMVQVSATESASRGIAGGRSLILSSPATPTATLAAGSSGRTQPMRSPRSTNVWKRQATSTPSGYLPTKSCARRSRIG